MTNLVTKLIVNSICIAVAVPLMIFCICLITYNRLFFRDYIWEVV